MIKQS